MLEKTQKINQLFISNVFSLWKGGNYSMRLLAGESNDAPLQVSCNEVFVSWLEPVRYCGQHFFDVKNMSSLRFTSNLSKEESNNIVFCLLNKLSYLRLLIVFLYSFAILIIRCCVNYLFLILSVIFGRPPSVIFISDPYLFVNLILHI